MRNKARLDREKDERQAQRDEQQVEKDKLAVRKKESAQARLKYLLAQSDIFEHFGKGTKAVEPGSPRKRMSEKEEDDAMLHEAHDTVRLTKQPSCIAFGTLRAYQLEGLNWMINLGKRGINGILADEMGLGKTLQTISVLAYHHEFSNMSGPHLVLVPKSTLSNWLAEFKRWCPVLRTVKFHGNKEERQRVINDVLLAGSPTDRKFDVCVTSFEMCIREKGALGKIAWRYLVIDEAHRIKNEASQFSQVVRSLETEHRLLLTGTPLQNNLHELWALLNFLLPDIFSSADQFDEWFNLDVDDDEDKKKMIKQLHRILNPFMIRRLKADVEKSLLPKKETLLFVGMSEMQKQLYKKLLLRDMESLTGQSNSRTALLNIVMQLRKCCGHPYLFEGQEDRTLDPMGEHLISNCGKMVLLDKLLTKLRARGSRVLIFSQMTRVLDILEDFMRMRAYDYCRIDGQTSYEVREDSIEIYNRENSPKFCFLLSTRAGGLGINLYTADTVILYDSDWNPQADLQAQDRAHRIGQKKQVNVYRFVTNNSVEEKVVERAQQKLKLDAMIVQQGRLQEQANTLSKNEMLEMIRFGADKVFRATDSADITDADIDAILAQGEARTEEMNAKLLEHDKGDLLDFKLDGGANSNIQTHDGVDYSTRKAREDEIKRLADIEFAMAMSEGMGKRERRPVKDYNVSNLQSGQFGKSKFKSKNRQIPKALRLPRMDDWQFYNRVRLAELHEQECKSWKAYQNREHERENENENENEKPKIVKTQFLSDDLYAEKQQLLAEGFPTWNKQHYYAFLRVTGRYGRENIAAIARDMNRTEADVAEYAAAFWKKGPAIFNDWEKIVKNIEKGESKLLEIQKIETQTALRVARYDNPFEYMPFSSYQGKQGKAYTEVEDRYMLCLANRHGYGAWDKVKEQLCSSDRFLFDFYLCSRNATEIGRRCDTLMRLCEKGNHDRDVREKKEQEICQRLEDERQRVAEKSKQLRQDIEKYQGKIDAVVMKEAKKMAAQRQLKRQWTNRMKAEKKLTESKSLWTTEAHFDKVVGPLLRYLRDHPIKDDFKTTSLAFIQQSGAPIPALAVVKKMKELTETSSKGLKWKIKPELLSRMDEVGDFELHDEGDQDTSASFARISSGSSDRIKHPSSKVKKLKSATNIIQKRKKAASEGAEAPRSKRGKLFIWIVFNCILYSRMCLCIEKIAKPPKRPRSAYVLFSLEHRVEVKRALPESDIHQLMNTLTTMWQELAPASVCEWEEKAEEDLVRYHRELEQYEELTAHASPLLKASVKEKKKKALSVPETMDISGPTYNSPTANVDVMLTCSETHVDESMD